MKRNVNFLIVLALGSAVGSFATLAVQFHSIFFAVLAIIAVIASILAIKSTPKTKTE